LKDINHYLNYFKNGLANLVKLKIVELDASEIETSTLSEEFFSSLDSLKNLWGFENKGE
jgi:hypothetical protein